MMKRSMDTRKDKVPEASSQGEGDVTFIEYLLHARHCATSFLTAALQRRYHCPHFANKKTKKKKKEN